LLLARDGEPIWLNPELIGDETKPNVSDKIVTSHFLHRVAQRLQVDGKNVFPAYEDVFYYMWRERRLPGNVDPFDSRVDDKQERERLMKVFTQGLQSAVGHVLPLARRDDGSGWQSGAWFLRSERCYLYPGDSPLGYRLPLDSLPWVKEGEYPAVYPADPTQAFRPLPSSAEIRRQLGSPQEPAAPEDRPAVRRSAWRQGGGNGQCSRCRCCEQCGPSPAPFESANWLTRTALCAEVRNGVFYLFMPPLSQLEHYLELVAAIEAVAEELKQPVLLEGYEPPHDPACASSASRPTPA
jgi:uncharacterized protein (DUF2126 family)